jgi:deoxyribose-phosphate aldolase
MALPSRETLEQLLQQVRSGKRPSPEALAWLPSLIDHTLLKPEATEAQVLDLCAEALQYRFGAVCVRLHFVKTCAQKLQGSPVKTAAVVGFPTGLEPTAAKVQETKEAVQAGAAEIDMVLQLDWLKAGELQKVYSDIQAVVAAAGSAPVKVILETCLLDREEKIMAGAVAKAAGAAFLKTSTGFSHGGATVEDVALLRRIAGSQTGVKASGGVKNLEDALKMVLAGANRLGTSSGVNILGGKSAQGGPSGVY